MCDEVVRNPEKSLGSNVFANPRPMTSDRLSGDSRRVLTTTWRDDQCLGIGKEERIIVGSCDG
jgi:hypothetical protein